jgi:dTDP-4-amino-4,6-dideoxygalactose transaminase
MRPKLPVLSELEPFFNLIDQSRIYSNYGPVSRELVLQYSKYLSVPPDQIVPLANATLAIQGALAISDTEDWLIPDYTFAATAHAAINAGKRIHLLDVDLQSYQLIIPNHLSREEYGAIPVLPFGAEVNFDKWRGFQSLVIDAAASLGSTPPNFHNMPRNTFVIYSLHATKVLGAGEGALVVASSAELAKKLRVWSNFGFDGTRVSNFPGANAKLSEFSCAIALASLNSLEIERAEWISPLLDSKRVMSNTRFETAVSNYSGFRPYWIISLESSEEKEDLQSFLLSNNIESRSWWTSRLSEMPAFSSLNTLVETVNSRHLAETHLGLPMWRDLPTADINFIGTLIVDFCH